MALEANLFKQFIFGDTHFPHFPCLLYSTFVANTELD